MGDADALSDWPMFGLADDVRPALARAVAAGRPTVLATLIEAVGGAPRPVGSQMLIDQDGPHGFLSGGCIEADVCAHARRALAAWSPVRLTYGEGGPFADIRLVCGGRIELMVEPLPPDDAAVRTLLELAARRRPAVWISDGVHRFCEAAGATAPPGTRFERLAEAMAAPGVGVAVAGRTRQAYGVGYAPPRRLVVIGADPIALAICALGLQCGLETWLVRPKGPSRPPPLPGLRYDRRPVEAAFGEIGLDRWTYVAAATHDLESDDDALAAALSSPAPYVGALGARRRLPERIARLRARGLGDAEIARLRAPIGLDLGGKAPFEIALAVLAEIIQTAEADRPRDWRWIEA